MSPEQQLVEVERRLTAAHARIVREFDRAIDAGDGFMAEAIAGEYPEVLTPPADLAPLLKRRLRWKTADRKRVCGARFARVRVPPVLARRGLRAGRPRRRAARSSSRAGPDSDLADEPSPVLSGVRA